MAPKQVFLCKECAKEMKPHCRTGKCKWLLCTPCGIIYGIIGKKYLNPAEG